MTLPIDSVLGWAWMMENHPELMEVGHRGFAPGENDHTIDQRKIALPLEMRESNGEWYWAASFAFGRPVLEERTHWHKRLDAQAAETYVDFGKRRGVVNTGSGYFKGYRMPLTIFLVPRLEWYVVGDAMRIQQLLSRVTHLGKKRSQGNGKVARWTVEPSSEDLSDRRPVPDPNGTEVAGFRPPYWWYKSWTSVRWPEDDQLACNYVRRGLVGSMAD